MDYEKKYDQLPNTYKGFLSKHGDTIAEYVNETDHNYVRSRTISEETDIDSNAQEIGAAVAALEEIYDVDLDRQSDRANRGLWIVDRLEKLPLQDLVDEVLE